ncbi:MAG: aldo/keto reductase [Tabrizicola sp.]|nr:aldo/keto reductase [Tabrizicola sp.]
MEYIRLGSSGLIVSRMAFGAMTFSSGNRDLPSVYKVESTVADRLVGQALDAGINFFDTADVYARGQSEEILGKALGAKREQVVIATKVGGRFSSDLLDAGLSRRHIMRSVDASLSRLGTDWIDVYIVHRDCPYTPLEEVIQALDDVVRAGKVRYLGFSNWPAWRVAKAMEMMRANGLAPFTHGQMFYSLAARDVENEFMPMLQQYGLGLTVWSPLAGGFLTGKYPRNGQSAEGTRHAGFDMMPIDLDRGYRVLDVLQTIAAAHNASPAQIALAWLLAKRQVSSILLGASKAEQLADTLKASQIKLSDEQMTQLEAASAPPALYPAWFIERFADRRTEKSLAVK